MIAQVPPLDWPEMLNHSVAIAVLAFIATWAIAYYKRTYGIEGTDTKESAARVACAKENAKTLAASQVTLVELKDLSARQQTLCGAHANGLVQVTTGLATAEGNAVATRTAAERVNEEWGGVRHEEFRTPPVLDVLFKMVKTAEVVIAKDGSDCEAEFRELRDEITEAKTRMKTA